MKTAAKFDAILKPSKNIIDKSVRVIVFDGDAAHCLNEGHLDTWWDSLPPVVKAEIYEFALGDAEERCRYCGCTQNRACVGGCSWLNAEHTVCSAPACAHKLKASMVASLADTTPVSDWINQPVQENARLVDQLMLAVAPESGKGGSVDAHC